MAKPKEKSTPTVRNKKARFQFELLEEFECGIVLTGTEVKSIRAGGCSLDEAYARHQNGEIWLIGCNIPPYSHGNDANHSAKRSRKLLLHKKQIQKIAPKVTTQGLTLVPVDIHFNKRGLAKVTLALARGKKMADKRQDLKKKDAKREMDRAMRRR